jgi:hypothetical protein
MFFYLDFFIILSKLFLVAEVIAQEIKQSEKRLEKPKGDIIMYLEVIMNTRNKNRHCHTLRQRKGY